jgi:phosphopantetheinyl transferase
LWAVRVRSDVTTGQLNAAECKRAEQIKDSLAWATFVTSRTAQRAILSNYLGVTPSEVVIDRACDVCGDPAHGRPRVDAPGLDYSVSHSGAWCLLAVASAPIGVDVERFGKLTDVEPLTNATLSGVEIDEFSKMAPRSQPAWFYRTWVRKEASSKATGVGQRLDFSTLDVRGDRAYLDSELWLYDLHTPREYAAALATSKPIETLVFCELDA